MLVQKTAAACFLDSDHLKNLDDLLDIVRCKIGRLIVYLTNDTMRRPWCAAEITTAYQMQQKALVVKTPSFVTPLAEAIQSDNLDSYVQVSDVQLFAALGIKRRRRQSWLETLVYAPET
jgi:hypothetical protein